jgi:hypothetical protein
MKGLTLSEKFMYYSGVLASAFPEAFPEAVEDLVHIQSLIDAEEQGLLLRLPCKVGDYVYAVEWNGVERYIVSNFDVCMKSIYAYQGDYFIGEMGYKVFPTKAEAEKKLAEMEE